MENLEWLEQYILERQKYIDVILENKKEDGICYISIEEIAVKTNRTRTTVKNKIDSINEDEIIIKQIGSKEFIITKENFKESETVKEYLFLLIYFGDYNNYNKNEKIIEQETGVSYKKIHHVKSIMKQEIKKLIKENNKK